MKFTLSMHATSDNLVVESNIVRTENHFQEIGLGALLENMMQHNQNRISFSGKGAWCTFRKIRQVNNQK